MGNETIALIDTHNYGGVTLSFDESMNEIASGNGQCINP